MTILGKQDKDGIYHVFMDEEPACILSPSQSWMWGAPKRMTQAMILRLAETGSMCPLCQKAVSVCELDEGMVTEFVDYLIEDEGYNVRQDQGADITPMHSHDISWRSRNSVTIEGVNRSRVFEVLDMQDCGFGCVVVLRRPGQSISKTYAPVIYTWGTLIDKRFTPLEVVAPASRRYRDTLSRMREKCREYATRMMEYAK